MAVNKQFNLKSVGKSGIEITPDLSLQTSAPTYLVKFINENEIDFIYKEKIIDNEVMNLTHSIRFDSINESNFDLTGSPLKLDMADESFNGELENNKKLKIIKLWLDSEEKHAPMSHEHSIMLLNNYLLKQTTAKNDFGWIWFLVDSKEFVLVGTKLQNNHWFNAYVNALPCVYYYNINLTSIMQETLQENFLKPSDVLVKITAEYNLSQNAVDEYNKFDDKLALNNTAVLQVNWNELSLAVPLMSAKSILHLKKTIGKDTYSNELWNELCRVQDLYNIIIENQNSSNDMLHKLIVPNSFSFLYEAIDKKLQTLLHTDYEFDIENNDEIGTTNLKNIAYAGRSSVNFCDNLWDILKDVSCYNQLVGCLNLIFNTIAHEKLNIQVESKSNTRLESLIYDVMNQRAAVPVLSGLQPFELLLELGVEKLCKNYINIFEFHNLFYDKIPFYDIPEKKVENVPFSMKPRLTVYHHSGQKSANTSMNENLFQNSRFDENVYAHKFKILSRIHVVLEVLILAENVLELDMRSLAGVCSNLMKMILYEKSLVYKPPQSINDLLENKTQSISIPLETELARLKINNLNPTSLHINFLSVKAHRKVNVQYYFSSQSIFPPNIFEMKIDEFEEKQEEKKDKYYGFYYYCDSHVIGPV